MREQKHPTFSNLIHSKNIKRYPNSARDDIAQTAAASVTFDNLPELTEMGTFKGISIDRCTSAADIYKVLR